MSFEAEDGFEFNFRLEKRRVGDYLYTWSPYRKGQQAIIVPSDEDWLDYALEQKEHPIEVPQSMFPTEPILKAIGHFNQLHNKIYSDTIS